MDMKLKDIIEGCLLGDGCIENKVDKYFYFKVSARDEKFVEWIKQLLENFNIHCWISHENKKLYSAGFYINTCSYNELLLLERKWYKKGEKRRIKIVPSDLKLTPTTLLFWYLGDGSLIRRKDDTARVPHISLATNSFSKEEVEFLKNRLKEDLGLNFYIVSNTTSTGFRKTIKTEYTLRSKVQDGTPFKFFKLIGLECPKEIANCITGSKGGSLHYFKDKWPNEEDWVRILSNVKEIGPILRKRRLELNLSQNQLGKIVGIRRENVRDVELMKRNFCAANFRKILNALNLNVFDLLKSLAS